MRRLRNGEYELVYVAPEGLEGSLRTFLAGVRVSLVVVDEAHCISEWGHDFRPAYRKLRGVKQELGGVPILALPTPGSTMPSAHAIRMPSLATRPTSWSPPSRSAWGLTSRTSVTSSIARCRGRSSRTTRRSAAPAATGS